MGKVGVSAWVTIFAASIGAAATLGAAYIQRQHEGKGLEATAPVIDGVATPQASVAGLDVVGVQIGAARVERYVAENRTLFKMDEEVAITVRYRAADSVEDFPVRLSAHFGNPFFGEGLEEEITDVAESGESFKTFRFTSNNRSPGRRFVRVEVNGLQVYSQTIDFQ